MATPVLKLGSIPKQQIGNDGDFSARIAPVSKLLGMKAMGCKLVELKPGEKAWPYHLHYAHEEFFVILEGSGTLRYNDKQYDVEKGDVVFAPPGDGTAHQLINTSQGQLSYLALSTTESPETCYYPDSGKYGSYYHDNNGHRVLYIGHESDAKNYYDGEQ